MQDGQFAKDVVDAAVKLAELSFRKPSISISRDINSGVRCYAL